MISERIPVEQSQGYIVRDVNILEPVTIILFDHAPGKGMVVVECYGDAWSAYFGAMPDNCLREFLARVDSDYLAGRMTSHMHKQRKGQQAYVRRIATAVIQFCRTGIHREPAR